jgi:hypothetical protein
LSSIQSDQEGLLLTLWDDDSPHFELYNRGIIAFSEYTWSGEKRTKKALKSAYRHREFSNAASNSELAFVDQLENPVAFWKNALLNGNRRNYLKGSDTAIEQLLIDLPDKKSKNTWSDRHRERLNAAKSTVLVCDSIGTKIKHMKHIANRNEYTLDIYEQVNKIVSFTAEMLLELERYDTAATEEEEANSLKVIKQKRAAFESIRTELESVYGKTRVMNKPTDYILDQDHHVHLANQSLNFDWQFLAEMLFFEKLESGL